jgi:hypothetical protein
MRAHRAKSDVRRFPGDPIRAMVKEKPEPGLRLEEQPVSEIGPDDVLVKARKTGSADCFFRLLRQWAPAVGGGRIGGVAGHRRQQIIIVPVAFAF